MHACAETGVVKVKEPKAACWEYCECASCLVFFEAFGVGLEIAM